MTLGKVLRHPIYIIACSLSMTAIWLSVGLASANIVPGFAVAAVVILSAIAVIAALIFATSKSYSQSATQAGTESTSDPGTE